MGADPVLHYMAVTGAVAAGLAIAKAPKGDELPLGWVAGIVAAHLTELPFAPQRGSKLAVAGAVVKAWIGVLIWMAWKADKLLGTHDVRVAAASIVAVIGMTPFVEE